MNKAVFLDKDGTLIENIPYNVDPEKIKFYPDVPPSLYKLVQRGYLLIVISNQSGVSFGYFEEKDLNNISSEIKKRLKDYKVEIKNFYYCPHHERGKIPAYAISCLCRKPKPGLIFQAQKDLNIDLKNSWIIGDILNDVEAGKRAGCKTILINNGNETEWIINELREPDFIVECFGEAVTTILKSE